LSLCFCAQTESGGHLRNHAPALVERDPYAPVVAALVVDLEDAQAFLAAGRGQMRAPAPLAVEARNLDDADEPIIRGWRRYGARADQAWLGLRGRERNIAVTDAQILGNRRVDRSLERA